MIAIYKREVKSYFTSMIGCVFVAFLVALTGIYFMVYNLNMGYPYFSYVLSGSMFVFLIAIPVLTMKCFAEERKNKTDQLLLTTPVSLMQIVLGKYLAMVTVFLIPNIIFCLFPLIIKLQGEAHFAVDYASILAFFLLGCVYIAIGMFLSALTESQIIAAIGTFGVLFILYMWEGLLNFLPTSALGTVGGILLIVTLIVLVVYQVTKNWLLSVLIEASVAIACFGVYFVKSSLLENLLPNVLGHFILSNAFQNIAMNRLLDLSGLFLYITIIVVFVFLTIHTLQKRRWS